MDFIPNDIAEYAKNHTSGESDLLKKLNRETHANVLKPRMLSGHLQGRLLALWSQMMQPNLILEIGTYTGYSALCLAEGLAENGKIITIEVNEELESFTRKHFKESAFAHKIDFRIGDATSIIPTIPEQFDIVFIDADKKNYAKYYNLVFEKVRKNGIIIADNVLWSGKVVGTSKIDKDTKALLDFNQMVQEDNRVENILLPIRDGLLIARKLI
jgi:caffeoyl-CoA O-methyltransferase